MMENSDGDDHGQKRSRAEADATNSIHAGEEEDSDNEHQTSKSRGAVTVQIFIKKTYKMINDCDPQIASWTNEGDKFVIKDPERFSNEVIPQYFDHNKFSSFTRQLNFYKFTREQSKVIKKSDSSNDIAKHQTFYHKYFQRGRPDLLKHLQRSKKNMTHDDHDNGGHGSNKKFKSGNHVMSKDEHSLLEQVGELVKKNAEFEGAIKTLQQDNATLSFAVQKLQQSDEVKQKSILALEEQISVMQLHMSQGAPQPSNPLPWNRESSLSAVNPSTLMRYLSMNSGLQRLSTPPFGNVTNNPKQFSAAAAAESLVQQQANESAAAAAAAAGGGGNAPTLPRHPRMKGSEDHVGNQKASADTPVDASVNGGAATLPRHPRMKGAGNEAAPGAPTLDGAPGTAATLPRHPNMKRTADTGASASAPSGAGGFGEQGGVAAAFANRNAFPQGLSDSELAARAGISFQSNALGQSGFGAAKAPGALGQSGFGGALGQAGLAGVGKSGVGVGGNALASLGQLRGQHSPTPASMMSASSLLERELSLPGVGSSVARELSLSNFGSGGLSRELSIPGAGAGLGVARELSIPGLGTGISRELSLPGAGVSRDQLAALSNANNAVTRDESFGIAAMMNLSRGQQPL